MKTIFALLAFLPTLVFSHGFCYSHGDCQLETNDGHLCVVAKTGSDMRGNITCSVRCITVKVGQYCEKFEGKMFGICKQESFDMPVFDPNDPNRCQDAIVFPEV